MRSFIARAISETDDRAEDAPLGINAFKDWILTPKQKCMTPHAYAVEVHCIDPQKALAEIGTSLPALLNATKDNLSGQTTLGKLLDKDLLCEVQMLVDACHKIAAIGNVTLAGLERKKTDAKHAYTQVNIDRNTTNRLINHLTLDELSHGWHFISEMYELAIASFLENDPNKKTLTGLLYISAMHMGKEIGGAIEKVADEYLRQANITIASENAFFNKKLKAYFSSSEAQRKRMRILAALIAADNYHDTPEDSPAESGLPKLEEMTLEWATKRFGKEETDLLCRLLPVTGNVP